MKPPWEWDESSIRELIANQVQESLMLDYEASDALAKIDNEKTELSKDVSAFANSASLLYDAHVVKGLLRRRP